MPICVRADLYFKVVICAVSDVKPSAVMVGNIVQGARMAWAQGRDLGISEDDADTSRKVRDSFLFLCDTNQLFF